jgi:hypothetical protein
MKHVWVIERFAPHDDHELSGYWVHETHNGAFANVTKMAKDDVDDLIKYDYRDNGSHQMPRVQWNGPIASVIDVDGSVHLLYNIKHVLVGA